MRVSVLHILSRIRPGLRILGGDMIIVPERVEIDLVVGSWCHMDHTCLVLHILLPYFLAAPPSGRAIDIRRTL